MKNIKNFLKKIKSKHMSVTQDLIKMYNMRKKLRFRSSNCEEMLRNLACIVVSSVLDKDKNSVYFAMEEASSIESYLVLNRDVTITHGIHTYLSFLCDAFHDSIDMINKEIHAELLDRYKKYGLKNMYNIENATGIEEDDSKVCKICMDKDICCNVSEKCLHEKLICNVCFQKLDECPFCMLKKME